MSWPLASHFSAMLQNPRLAFRDAELKECTIAKDERNQPRPWSGSFAVVYQGISATDGRPFAVRIFTTESSERRERYHQISAYLKNRRLDCLVDFTYHDESIRSAGDGKWYPLILMDWVEGETLFRWAGSRCREGASQTLSQAAARWIELVKELGQAAISHGDLQHANVMVTAEGDLKLVDYDCMCVPSLVGRRNLEVGVEPYQHRQRNESTLLSLDLDNFSAITIYVALRALAADPTLWDRFVQRPEHDKLLFRTDDFRVPAASPLCAELRSSPDREVRELIEELLSLWQGPKDDVPPLEHLTNSYAKVERLLRAGQWDAAVELLNRRGNFRDAPQHLQGLIDQAYEHASRRQAWADFQRIQPAVDELHDRKLANAWQERLFAGFEPAERQRARYNAAARNVANLDRLHGSAHSAEEASSIEVERAIVDAAAQLPQDYGYTLWGRVERARRYVDAVRFLEQTLLDGTDDVTIARMWRRVSDAKCRRLVLPSHGGRIKLAIDRAGPIAKLRRIPEELPLDEFDRRLLEIWQDDLLTDCQTLQQWRQAWLRAVARKTLLDAIQLAIRNQHDAELVKLSADPVLAEYPLPSDIKEAIRTTRDRGDQTEALIAALSEGDRVAFAELFDARLIRDNADRFTRHGPKLFEWVTSDILPAGSLGLAPLEGQASLTLVDRAAGAYRLRWTWPASRFTDDCVVGVTLDKPRGDSQPDDLRLAHRLAVDRASWISGGESRLLRAKPEWDGAWVVVWALVDMGFRALPSEPLVLGRIEAPKSPWGRGLGRLSPFSTRKKPAP